MAIQTFTALQVLTAAQMNALQANDYNQTVSTKTASYTLVAADKGTRIVMNAGATNTTITVNTSLFAAGDTLQILNISTSGTCTVTAGTCTVATAGSLALGLNQGGTLYFTSAGVSVFLADGVTAGSGTKIGQVLSAIKQDTFTTSSASFIDVTGLTVSITPTLNTSKILVIVSISGGSDIGYGSGAATIARGGTNIFGGTAAGSRTLGAQFEIKDNARFQTAGLSVLDSPATTSATTYSVQVISTGAGGAFYVNRSPTDVNSAGYFRGASSITVCEVIA